MIRPKVWARPLRDSQLLAPAGWCRRCRGELYGGEEGLCPACRLRLAGGEGQEEEMTLSELSGQYRAGAEALRARALDLEGRRQGEADAAARRLLDGRIRLLRAMWREARELAALCEHYYERGYRRSGRYTL